VVGPEDQKVVDAIRGEDTIESIKIGGDTASLLEKEKGRIERWNATLGTR
jgi:peptidyl-prolyl cis-trans isomerase B (cyclophilin B)